MQSKYERLRSRAIAYAQECGYEISEWESGEIDFDLLQRAKPELILEHQNTMRQLILLVDALRAKCQENNHDDEATWTLLLFLYAGHYAQTFGASQVILKHYGTLMTPQETQTGTSIALSFVA